MNSFHLQIITHNGTIYDGEATYLNVPTIDGLYAIQANHSNVIIQLDRGVLSFTAGEEKNRLEIEGGILHFSENHAKAILNEIKTE